VGGEKETEREKEKEKEKEGQQANNPLPPLVGRE